MTLVAKLEEWPKWSRRFERFRQASGLAKEEEESQINTLIYAMGDQADDILNSFKLSTTQLKQYHTVKTKFDEHFVVRRNVIFERAKFNQRRQEEGETVDTFITALHALAEHCNFGTLTDEIGALNLNIITCNSTFKCKHFYKLLITAEAKCLICLRN